MKKLTFYIDKFCIINNISQSDLKDFTSVKRRLSTGDQASVSAIDKVFNNDVREIIYASEYGEFDKLGKIIDEYTTHNEVSPIKFSGSVHNYPVGCYNFTKKINIPYQAISAGKNTIGTALINCIISSNSPVIMCYTDNFENNLKCVSCLISKNKLTKNATQCEFEKTSSDENFDEYQNLFNFLENKTNVFNSNLCTIRKV